MPPHNLSAILEDQRKKKQLLQEEENQLYENVLKERHRIE
jgi:hypothetical protein